MNYYSPTVADLATEDRAEALILRQIAFQGALTKWLRHALTTLPLPDVDQTWPCLGVDREDLVASLQYALLMMDHARVEDWARDRAEAING